MRKVEAIIRVSASEDVYRALQDYDIEGLTASEVFGCGHEASEVMAYRGTTYGGGMHPRMRLEIVVPDAQAIPVANAVCRAARAGRVGDGVVTIGPVLEAVRVRTGERGLAAITTLPGAVRKRTPARPGPAVSLRVEQRTV